MIAKFKKHTALLFAGSFSMVLAACYEMPVNIDTGKSVRTLNETNEPIPGLKMQLTNNGERILEEYSDTNGWVYFGDLEENESTDYQVIITDIDGEENGGLFQTKVIDITQSQDEYIVNLLK